MKRAVIDVGSNSVILLIGERNATGCKFFDEHTRVTALGEGVKASGLLGEAGMLATLEALRDFFECAHRDGALEVEAWGTMALRMAGNAEAFLKRAAGQGTPVRVLSGEAEAQLGFLSVVEDPLFAAETRISIIDPGGQSTELVTAVCPHPFDDWQIAFRHSFPVGTLGLRGEPLSSPAPSGLDLLKAIEAVDNTIGLEYRPEMAGLAIVLGAAGTNLVSVRDRLETWQPKLVHGATLRYDEVSRAVSELSALGDEGRAALVGLEPGRERTIHLGALILERFMHAIHVLEVRVSVRGWRHAVLAGAETEAPSLS